MIASPQTLGKFRVKMQDELSSKVKLSEGVLIRHPVKPEWGLGKVLDIRGNSATIFFKDDTTDHRTILLDKVQLQLAEEQSDPMLDKLSPFIDGKFATKHKKVTIQDGIGAFKAEFPGGFLDPAYLDTQTAHGERSYKIRAHERYLDAFGGGKGPKLLKAAAYGELREQAHAIATKDQMNLLSPYEAMALRDGLAASDTATKDYFQALFEFVDSGPTQPTFNALSAALSNIPVDEGKARAATWPTMTLLPFLADPRRFMFLKPEPTRACAERLRFDLLYDPAIRWSTYERLMEMTDHLLEELESLGAQDYIDAQSFMWVIEKY